MPYKNPEDKKKYNKQYRETKHYKEYNKTYREKHKERLRLQRLMYYQTPAGQKSMIIRNWRRIGIIFPDEDLLYQIYMETTHCDECKCELNKCNKSKKCMDHDHSTGLFRNILCHSCNIVRR